MKEESRSRGVGESGSGDGATLSIRTEWGIRSCGAVATSNEHGFFLVGNDGSAADRLVLPALRLLDSPIPDYRRGSLPFRFFRVAGDRQVTAIRICSKPTGCGTSRLDSFLGLPGGAAGGAGASGNAMLYQRWATRQLADLLGCRRRRGGCGGAARRRRRSGLRPATLCRRRIEAIRRHRLSAAAGRHGALSRPCVPTQTLTVYRIEPPIKALLDERFG